jgi:hypothetical protein
MCNRLTRLILIGAMVCVLSACGAAEHTNTLLFGTNTKVALDISVNPTGGTPDVTLGYKRQEAVWMPLLANQGSSSARTPIVCNPASDCIFKSREGQDTYSVLASFGADFSSQGGNDSGQAAGGLAQFFATGLAAQKLAAQGGAQLISVRSANTESVNAANRRADEAEKKLIQIARREDDFAKQEKQERIDKILDGIDALPDDKAIALEKAPPVTDTTADAVVGARDPNNERAKNAGVAKEMLKTRAVLGSNRSDDVLAAWEAAVKAQ